MPDRFASPISIFFKFAHHSSADLLNTVGKERGFGYAKIAQFDKQGFFPIRWHYATAGYHGTVFGQRTYLVIK